MKYLKYTVLTVLLFLSMSLIGICVFWILKSILGFSFDNIIYSGIKAGILSSITVILVEVYSKKNRE